MSYLTEEEKQQILFDWRYEIYYIKFLTEEVCYEIIDELERLSKEIQSKKKEDGSDWGDWDPFAYPHKDSKIIQKYFSHPKIIEIAEFLMGGKIKGTQSWAYFKPPGQLGRDIFKMYFAGIGIIK